MPVGDPGELEQAKEPNALKESWKARVGTHEVPECPLTLITKLQHIDYRKYTDGIYGSKDVIHGFQKM